MLGLFSPANAHARDSPAASLDDPPPNLLILAVGEAKCALLGLLPIFRKQCRAHDFRNGVGVGTQ